MAAPDVAALATRLAGSGEQIAWSGGTPVADLASTGGPGSLSTLLAPLELRCAGLRVVKLGVPGRPAGGIDALGTIPGYRVRLSPDEVRHVVQTCGYAHFLADEQFAPEDASLFAYRREHDAVAIPALAAASLLAKKIAVGVQFVGLDVRVGSHGNFGATLEEARENAVLFCEAARLVGIDATAFLFAGSGPEQPWIGRGEALVALQDVLTEQATGNLRLHDERCVAMCAVLAGHAGMDSGHRTSGRAELFNAHLEAQGATPEAFVQRVQETGVAYRSTIKAKADGEVLLDVAALREALVAAQRRGAVGELSQSWSYETFPDPAGLFVRRGRGRVQLGEVLGELRHLPDDHEVVVAVTSAFVMQGRALGELGGAIPMEVVRA